MVSQIDIDAAPKITLAGKQFSIPMLVPRQQRIVVPKIVSLMKQSVEGSGRAALSPLDITTELYDDLIEIVFVALSRAHPDISRDQFMDMETTALELIAAVDTIAKQTGVFKKPGEAAPGEAQAGSQSTGTQSSPG